MCVHRVTKNPQLINSLPQFYTNNPTNIECDYHFIALPRQGRKVGGVGILINDQLQYSNRSDLTFQTEEIESCFIELASIPKKNNSRINLSTPKH